jgi:hypothetical protein
MSFDRAAVKERIRKFDFAGLFTQELGWDRHKGSLTAHLPDRDVVLNAVAEKRGFAVWHCPTLPDQKLPDSALRRRIERELTKAAHEHILIFTDARHSLQVWQWVRREAGKPTRVRETLWTKDQPGELLAQKLDRLFVSLDEEEKLTLVDVTSRVAGNVDERVTKRFYEEFRKQHAAFLKFITGIPNQGDHEWYASVMLNRLMFLYFVQRKGFLDGDPDYLRNRLRKTKREHGKDKFYNFYRYFLLKLFHGGLNARPPRQPDLEKLLGRVPYLNGGIFDIHQLERTKAEGGYGPDIQMPDKAFETVFDYFDRYQWHLDERPLRADNEINPDVLGYIFEKYVNQKQMGAYYTKEDITDYIGKNTILPFVFDSARNRCKSAFDGANSVWTHLQQEPDRYIYPAVRHGISWDYQAGHASLGEPLDKPRELPSEIAKGIDSAKPNLIERRKAWNKPAPSEFGLPTEIWRETIARRQRCEELQRKLAEGGVRDINDFITLNLDIRRFAQDAISRCDSPDLLAAFWHSLAGRPPRKSDERTQHGVTILDPTCGSGAFLFAALNILEPLYETCLDRMGGLLADARVAKGDGWKPPLYSHLAEFEQVLSSVADHPNERYFIFKSIILHNLYGVDIMEEAVEICKLRLFLKLAAQVEPDSADRNLGIEPLPDIDFNIRAGNTLVGYATHAELEVVGQADLLLKGQVKEVLDAAEDAAVAYDVFVRSQLDGENPAEFKRRLLEKLGQTRERCDRFLAESYFGGKPKPKDFSDWKRSHQPFHWFVEFFGILNAGGFDVIIGNPPYVEYKEVRESYTVRDYATETCENLYAFCYERAIALTRLAGRIGFIIPVSSVCTDGYAPLQRCLHASGSLVISNFNDRPGKLFEGLEHIRLSIVLLRKTPSPRIVFSTRYNKWHSEARESLFPSLVFENVTAIVRPNSVPKIGDKRELQVAGKISTQKRRLADFTTQRSPHVIRYTRKLSAFVQILDFIPEIRDAAGKKREPSELKEIPMPTRELRDAFLGVLNSSIFYWYLTIWSDCRNLNSREVLGIPMNATDARPDLIKRLGKLSAELMADFKRNAVMLSMNYKKWGAMKIQCIYPKHSKPILDQIDAVLAEHYGLTEEELDFIVNYDIKYRLGGGGEAVED